MVKRPYMFCISNTFFSSGTEISFSLAKGSPSSLYEKHMEHYMASNCKVLYGIFYKTSMEVVES